MRGGEIRRGDEVIATGDVQDPAALRELNDERRREIGEALEAFARNTVEHMLEERELLVGKIELPRFDTEFRDRPALVVVRGVDHKRDLRALRPYVRDVKPVIVAVDGGADALVEFLDKNRRGMSSTFLTRLRVGEILVDAKGVSRLYRPRPGLWPIVALFVVGVIAFVAIVALTPGLRDVADLLWLKLQVLLGIDA